MATGGYRSEEGIWEGGVSAPSGIHGGYRSPLAFWIGGGEAVPTVSAGGYRSLEAWWLGGAESAIHKIIFIGGGGLPTRRDRWKLNLEKPEEIPLYWTDDEEILLLLMLDEWTE